MYAAALGSDLASEMEALFQKDKIKPNPLGATEEKAIIRTA